MAATPYMRRIDEKCKKKKHIVLTNDKKTKKRLWWFFLRQCTDSRQQTKMKIMRIALFRMHFIAHGWNWDFFHVCCSWCVPLFFACLRACTALDCSRVHQWLRWMETNILSERKEKKIPHIKFEIHINR